MSGAQVALRVGLVGAGVWAEAGHVPLLLGGTSDLVLAGVWSRRFERAAVLAARHSTMAFSSLPDLIESVDVLAFAVPPAAQAELAWRGASRGKALLLDKPLAADEAGAAQLCQAVARHRVSTCMFMTFRLGPAFQDLKARLAGRRVIATSVRMLSGAFRQGRFAVPWRVNGGVLLDAGVHALDLAMAVAGPVEKVRAMAGPERWVSLTARHAGGALSRLDLCSDLQLTQDRLEVEVVCSDGIEYADLARGLFPAVLDQLRQRLVWVLRESVLEHDLSADRGLVLQRLLAEAAHDLA
jgi:predicted dehydrogenase